MNYSKKQMQPLIDKYSINPETNKLFIKVCEMFEDQPNYQVWAVKMVFSSAIQFDGLGEIHQWIVENNELIPSLSKKNIISYTTKSDIEKLFDEMSGLKKVAFIKKMISNFNTTQRKMLISALFGSNNVPINLKSRVIDEWYKIFKIFDKKPWAIKHKFYSTCSALKSSTSLCQAIKDCLAESYTWENGKEDLLSFISYNTPDCDVVFDEGNCVVVRVPSYNSSHKLCGSGRTGWCICREEGYFRNYVTSKPNRAQYFLFDFNRKESDAFAHIGFTIEFGRGIVEAQTCHNYGMMQPFEQGNEKLSIHDVLKNFGISMSTFMKLPKDLGFGWDINSICKLISENGGKVVYNANGRIVAEANGQLFTAITKKTFIGKNDFQLNGMNKIFLCIDLNLQTTDGNCIIAISYAKDKYGSYSLGKINNALGEKLDEKSLSELGINTENLFDLPKLDPSVLLHKYIDENNEEAAIKLINSDSKVNVNYIFNNRAPVFAAINNCMTKLYDTIVNHKDFDSNYKDGYGETLLEMLLYLYGNPEVAITKDDKDMLKTMINSTLASETFDFNARDYNNDTVINSACTYKEEEWVVGVIASLREVDVNVVDDFGSSPLTTCITNKNLGALKILGMRPDLKVTDEDRELAKSFKIDLDKYIKPSESIFGMYPRPKRMEYNLEEKPVSDEVLAEVFAEA